MEFQNYEREDINVIKVLTQKLDTVEEMWIYEINDKVLDYQNLKNNKSYLFENGKSNCENCSSNELENILNTFYRIVNNSVVV